MQSIKVIFADLNFRRGLRAAFAVMFAIGVSYIFGISEKFWIPVTAFLVLQNEIGSNLGESFKHLIIILLAAALSFFLVFFIKINLVLYILIILAFGISVFMAIYTAYYKTKISNYLIAALILTIGILFSKSGFYTRIQDIFIGGVIGLVCSLLILPAKPDLEFRKKTIPILQLFSDYLALIVELLYKRPHALSQINSVKNKLEDVWESYPDWVYNSGYLYALQAGHRHFLIRLNQVLEILLSLHYIARQPIDEKLILSIQPEIDHFVHLIRKLISAELTVLNLQLLSEGVEDLGESAANLEKAFKSAIPLSIDAIDINSEYLLLAQFVYNLKELGTMFTIMAKAMR